MRKVGLLKAFAFVYKADKMGDRERIALQQLRLKELTAYVKKTAPILQGFTMILGMTVLYPVFRPHLKRI